MDESAAVVVGAVAVGNGRNDAARPLNHTPIRTTFEAVATQWLQIPARHPDAANPRSAQLFDFIEKRNGAPGTTRTCDPRLRKTANRSTRTVPYALDAANRGRRRHIPACSPSLERKTSLCVASSLSGNRICTRTDSLHRQASKGGESGTPKPSGLGLPSHRESSPQPNLRRLVVGRRCRRELKTSMTGRRALTFLSISSPSKCTPLHRQQSPFARLLSAEESSAATALSSKFDSSRAIR